MKSVDNLDFFIEKKSLSKRGFNSRRDKFRRKFEAHPASIGRKKRKHGR